MQFAHHLLRPGMESVADVEQSQPGDRVYKDFVHHSLPLRCPIKIVIVLVCQIANTRVHLTRPNQLL